MDGFELARCRCIRLSHIHYKDQEEKSEGSLSHHSESGGTAGLRTQTSDLEGASRRQSTSKKLKQDSSGQEWPDSESISQSENETDVKPNRKS